MMNWRDQYPEMGPMQDAYGPKSGTLRGAEKTPSIGAAVECLDIHLKELGECVRHLEMLRDRVTGPHPQEVKGVNEIMDRDKVPHSLINSIHMRRSELASWVKALEAVTCDLEQSI